MKKYKQQLVKNLRTKNDSEIKLTDFSSSKLDKQSYTVNDFLRDTSERLQEQSIKVLKNDVNPYELSLTDAFADVIDEKNVNPSILSVYLVILHRSSLSLASMVKDVFDMMDDELTSEIFDFYLSFSDNDQEKIPTVIQIALQATMSQKEYIDSHSFNETDNSIHDFPSQKLN